MQLGFTGACTQARIVLMSWGDMNWAKATAVVAFIATCGWASIAGAHATGLMSPAEQRLMHLQLERQPMAFFVAKGSANSCGPGCDRWIAAEGVLTPGTAKRFEDFLGEPSRQGLPVFFHSRGGNLLQAFQIGQILRKYRMTAGIGRTITERCRVFSTKDEACQRLISSGGDVKARLSPHEGQCHSACVYAFVGASSRRVASGAMLGVHAHRVDLNALKQMTQSSPETRAPPDPAVIKQLLQQYLTRMGIDLRLEETAIKVSTHRMYVLSPDEIARFGIETRSRYETSWLGDKDRSGRPFVLKSVTEPTGPDDVNPQTSVVRAHCRYKGWIALTYERAVRTDEDGVLFNVRAGLGDTSVGLREGIAVKTIFGSHVFNSLDFLQKAIAAGHITFTESFSPRRALGWSRAIKFSTTGLAPLLSDWPKLCMES
jgi:hypothetical protein